MRSIKLLSFIPTHCSSPEHAKGKLSSYLAASSSVHKVGWHSKFKLHHVTTLLLTKNTFIANQDGVFLAYFLFNFFQ